MGRGVVLPVSLQVEKTQASGAAPRRFGEERGERGAPVLSRILLMIRWVDR